MTPVGVAQSQRAGTGDDQHVAGGYHCFSNRRPGDNTRGETLSAAAVTAGTNHDAILSARRWIGAFELLRAAHHLDDALEVESLPKPPCGYAGAAGPVQAAACHGVARQLVPRACSRR